MKFTLPKNAFPVVELSEDQHNTFIDQADTIVKEIAVANDAFIANGGVLRDPQWRLVRTKKGMQVYRLRGKVKQRGRKSSTHLMESPSWSSTSRYRAETSNHDESSIADRATSIYSSSGVADDSIMEKFRPPGVSLMGLHGTMDGTLDDCMFGCFAPNDEEWKLRSSYINDRLDDSRIVASIRGPTEEDPYRYLAIKWLAVEQPTVLSGIVQRRDFLILEGSGFTRDPNGEKVGYFLMHSVTLRQIPELSELGIVRGLMSYCYIFRQGKPGKVDIYTRGFFDSRGDMPGRLSVAISAEATLCCVNLIEYAHIKKLMWLMKRDRSRGATQSSRYRARLARSVAEWLSPALLSSVLPHLPAQREKSMRLENSCDMTAKFHLANYVEESALQTGATQFTLANGEQIRQWSPHSDPRKAHASQLHLLALRLRAGNEENCNGTVFAELDPTPNSLERGDWERSTGRWRHGSHESDRSSESSLRSQTDQLAGLASYAPLD
ncbi:hypothetical protein ON010_g530 [Phytophthora cinnamomi]|nr:hypothetical protein ON010_g530 [Phytophthora cinnamomi]